MDVSINPADPDGRYLASLNACFPGWGGEAAYRWAFGRTVRGPAADLMMLSEGAELLAGSAVSYRTLRTAAGHDVLIGIMTGSWTLPAARGRGCFTRVIEESVRLVKDKGGGFLLAFVTETNASFRRLEAAGSTLYPTTYLVSAPAVATGAAVAGVEHPAAQVLAAPEPWFEAFEARRVAGSRFLYGSAAEWAGQFLGRGGVCSVVEFAGLGFACVEQHGDFDRLQGLAPERPELRGALVEALRVRAAARGRRVFLFESERGATAEGLSASPGYLTALAASELAGDAASLGPWRLHSGDRM